MKRCVLFPGIVVLGFCLIMLVFAGCETTGDADELTVTPRDVTVVGSSNVVTFTVAGDTNTMSGSGLRPLSLPLEWRVSNPALGYISGSSGYSASYVRNAPNGVNTVYVRDQYGAEGHVTVSQQ